MTRPRIVRNRFPAVCSSRALTDLSAFTLDRPTYDQLFASRHAALLTFTSNVARLLRLPRKGRIAGGFDADLVVLDDEGLPTDVMAGGQWHVAGGQQLLRGPFEAGADRPSREDEKP